MDTNSKEANDLAWIEKVNSVFTSLNNTSIGGIGNAINIVQDQKGDLFDMLEIMTEEIDKPIFKSLANDMIGVFGSFYFSEDMLCCLVKNILITLKLDTKLIEYRKFILEMKAKMDPNITQGLHIDDASISYVISETSYANSIDALIAIIDIVLVFLELELGKDIIFPALDFIREITEATVGFLCIAMQQMLFSLRDQGIEAIIKAIDENTSKSNWAKCLPYMDFISIIKKYIHDYGLLDRLMSLIQGFTADWFRKFEKKIERGLPKNVKLITLLRAIKDMLLKIKNAVISFEYCIFLNDDPAIQAAILNDENPYFKYIENVLNAGDGRGTNDFMSDGFFVSDNDTILVNSDDGSGDLNSKGQNSIKVPNNDEIRNFLLNYMGLSTDKVDQMLADGGMNSGDGKGTGTANSCGYIINPSDITYILDQIIEQSRIG